MEVVQPTVLCCRLDVAESLGLLVVVLRLVDYLESGVLHSNKILPAEFPVVSNLPDFESALAHIYKPVNHVSVVNGGAVAQRQPSVLRPAKERNVVLVCFNVRGNHREKCVGDDDIRPLVLSKERRSREVMELGKVCSAVPVNGQLCQLVQAPVVFVVAASEFVDVEISLDGVGIDIERFGEKVLPLLGIVLSLQGIVEDFRRADAHAIGRVCHLVDLGVGEINRPIFDPFWGAAHEDEILLVLYRAV